MFIFYTAHGQYYTCTTSHRRLLSFKETPYTKNKEMTLDNIYACVASKHTLFAKSFSNTKRVSLILNFFFGEKNIIFFQTYGQTYWQSSYIYTIRECIPTHSIFTYEFTLKWCECCCNWHLHVFIYKGSCLYAALLKIAK